jgi:hypothetical protein
MMAQLHIEIDEEKIKSMVNAAWEEKRASPAEIDRVTRLVYGAIKGWQDGVMADLEDYDDAVAAKESSGPLDISRETATKILNGTA